MIKKQTQPRVWSKDLKDWYVAEIVDLVHYNIAQLKEAEERVVAEAKRRIYITCLANGNDKEGTYWITYGEVQELLDQLLIKSKDNV